MNRIILSGCAACVCLAILVVLASGQHARAASYAYSNLEILDASSPPDPLPPGLFIDMTNRATFGGFGTDEATTPSTPPNNPRQAKSGPGGFPNEDTFTPHGKQGQYARSDSALPDMNGNANSVAEAYRVSPGTADASSRTHISEDHENVAADEVLTFVFAPNVNMKVMTDNDGDVATAIVHFDVRVYARDISEFLLTWNPMAEPPGTPGPTFTKKDGEGVVFDTMEPYSLNKLIRCSGACMMEYSATPVEVGLFKLSYRFTKPHRFVTVSLLYDNLVEVSVRPVPEPASVTMGLGGIMALVACVHRRGRRR